MADCKRFLCFIYVLVFCLAILSGSVSGIGAQSGFSEEENYDYVKDNWNGSVDIDFEEYWEGDNRWGGYHRVYSVQIDTKELIEQDKLRGDCLDIRVASEGQLLGSRVQDNTCNTSETWVYFSNPDTRKGLKFDRNDTIENIQVFYGNKDAGLSKYTTSVYNDDVSTLLKPESAVGMYYGHHQSVYVNDQTDNVYNDKDAPEQEWSVDFETDHGDTNTDYIHISDDDGNSATYNSGDTYTITSSNAPSWVEQGDTLTIYFKSQEVCYNSCDTATSDSRSAQWGYPVQFINPDPAKSTGTSPVETSSPDLQVDVDEPSGNDVDVTFYDNADDSQIGGTQTITSGSGTAVQEWSGLVDGNTYRWYVEGCTSSGCKKSSTFEFDVNGFPEITDLRFTNRSDRHGFNAEITVEDANGDGDLDSCDATATGGGTSMNYNNLGFGGVDGDNTATCSVEIQYNDPGTDWNHLQDLNVEFTVSDSKNSDTESGSNSFPNNPPRVTDISFSNYSERHRFNTTALLLDPDSETSGEIDFCSFNFSDGEGNYKYVEPSVDNSVSTDQAECSYSNINHSITGFEVLEDIDVDVKVGDMHGSNSSAQSSNVIPNSVPYAANPVPSDGGIVFEFPVGLEATVMDDDVGDTLSTKIYNSDTGEEIESFPPLSSGDEVSTDWQIQNALQQEYSWDVEVSDSWSATNTTFSFTKIVGRTYRSDLGLNLNYSSIVMNAGGNRYTELKVTNNVQNEKNLTVNLTGIDAEFLDGSTVKEIPEFEGQSRRTYTVRISPDEPTDEDLTVVATNNDIGVETEKTIPVTTLSNSQESNEVPGVGVIQLLALSIASTVLYYRFLTP